VVSKERKGWDRKKNERTKRRGERRGRMVLVLQNHECGLLYASEK